MIKYVLILIVLLSCIFFYFRYNEKFMDKELLDILSLVNKLNFNLDKKINKKIVKGILYNL